MSTHKHFDQICVAVTVLALLLTMAFMNGESLGITKVIDQDRENNSDSAYFTTNDQWSDWSTDGATVITLNGDSAKVSGSGAYANGAHVVITQSGSYVVSGTLTDGNLTVDAKSSSKVWILLNGVDIICSDDAALRVDQADKVFLTLAEGTENSLTSGETMSDTALADGTDGAIFAHDDLTINGSGSLTVTALYKHGIAANDDLVITGGTITVTAPADAIHANDSLRMKEATITVEAGDDGLATSNEGAYLYVESGAVNVKSEDDGLHVAGDITIDGGALYIEAGDDGIHSDTAVTINAGTVLIQECYEGIEAKTIDVNGGDITVYPSDDGFNANGGSSGMMGGPGGGGGFGGGMGGGFGGGMGNQPGSTDSTGDSTGGQMPQRPEESQSADNDGATLVATAAVTTGTAESGRPEMPSDGAMPQESGQAQTSEVESSDEEETYIRITGGTITIINANAQDADGLDSNGSIYIDGGYILISLSGDGSNNAIDYGSENGGVAEITGGTIIACGGSAMAESFDESSTQGSIFYTMSTVAAGTNLTVKDSTGNVLLTWDVPASYSAVTVSCPEMTVGETYQVMVGDTVQEVTLDSTAVTVGSAAGGFGGMGGGMRGGWNSSGSQTTDGAQDSAGGSATQGFGGGMRGGHGGKGMRPGQQTATDGSTDTAITDGAMPSFPPDGEMPDFSQMGQPPEMSGETTGSDGETAASGQPTPPDMSQMSGGHGGMGDRQAQTTKTEESAGEVTVETETAQEVSTETWITLALCGAFLLAGLVFGFAWKKHG